MTLKTKKWAAFFQKSKILSLIDRIHEFLNPKQKRLIARLRTYLHKKKKENISIKIFAQKLFRLNLSSYKYEIKFYFQLVKQVSDEKFVVGIMENHFVGKKVRPKKVKKVLPAPSTVALAIKNLFESGKTKLSLLLVIMFITGRRSIDIMRLKKKNVKKINKNLYAASIPKDKKHSTTRHFEIDLSFYIQDWCGLKINQFLKSWDRLLNSCKKEELIFKGVCKASLARDVKLFKPHIIRSIRAILLLKMGKSERKVMRYIGWDDQKSLSRYVKVNKAILARSSWEEICEAFNNQS